MTQRVGIAELKSRLSAYLRAVRRGHTLTVLDRDTPVARIVPYAPGVSRLVVRRPLATTARFGDVALPPPLRLDRDVVKLLLEERGER
ncbi:MAG: type II toxin-antitoxin system Phd/YefM family antitoxin [Longimicrobiales bacterium]